MAYVTPEQFLDRYDLRDVGDLVSKDGERVTESGLQNNSKLLRSLEDASGQVRSACRVGNKYSIEDLETLAKDQDPFLVQIVCDLALGRLQTSRSLANEITPDVERAQQWVALLRLGERILEVPENTAAGLTTHGFISDFRRFHVLRFAADVASPRYFPFREPRLGC